MLVTSLPLYRLWHPGGSQSPLNARAASPSTERTGRSCRRQTRPTPPSSQWRARQDLAPPARSPSSREHWSRGPHRTRHQYAVVRRRARPVLSSCRRRLARSPPAATVLGVPRRLESRSGQRAQRRQSSARPPPRHTAAARSVWEPTDALSLHPSASCAPLLKKERIPERGVRRARRDDRKYWWYLREEKRRPSGCPAREAVLHWPRHATSEHRAFQPARSDAVRARQSATRPSDRPSSSRRGQQPEPFRTSR
jgi:hypothetical protein